MKTKKKSIEDVNDTSKLDENFLQHECILRKSNGLDLDPCFYEDKVKENFNQIEYTALDEITKVPDLANQESFTHENNEEFKFETAKIETSYQDYASYDETDSLLIDEDSRSFFQENSYSNYESSSSSLEITEDINQDSEANPILEEIKPIKLERSASPIMKILSPLFEIFQKSPPKTPERQNASENIGEFEISIDSLTDSEAEKDIFIPLNKSSVSVPSTPILEEEDLFLSEKPIHQNSCIKNQSQNFYPFTLLRAQETLFSKQHTLEIHSPLKKDFDEQQEETQEIVSLANSDSQIHQRRSSDQASKTVEIELKMMGNDGVNEPKENEEKKERKETLKSNFFGTVRKFLPYAIIASIPIAIVGFGWYYYSCSSDQP